MPEAEAEEEEMRIEEAPQFQPLTGGLELIGQEVVPVAEGGAEATDEERKVPVAQEPTTPTRSSTGRPEAVSSAKASGGGATMEMVEVSKPVEAFETPNRRTATTPLFTPDQIRALEEVQSQAPAIYGGRQRKEDPAELRRPEFLKNEERRMKKPLMEASPKVKARLKPEVYKMDSQEEPEEDPREEELVWRFKVGRKLEEMDLRLRERDLENDFLREELRRLKEAELGSTFNTPEEDGARAQQALFVEDGAEDGARARQASAKEDGARAQQDFSFEEGARARQASTKEDGARARQASRKEDGARAQQDGGGFARNGKGASFSYGGGSYRRSGSAAGRRTMSPSPENNIYEILNDMKYSPHKYVSFISPERPSS